MRRAMPRSGSASRTREQPVRSSAPTLSVERTATFAPPSTVFRRTTCRNRHKARRRYGRTRLGSASARRAALRPRRRCASLSRRLHRARRRRWLALRLSVQASQRLPHRQSGRAVIAGMRGALRFAKAQARRRQRGCHSTRRASAIRACGLPTDRAWSSAACQQRSADGPSLVRRRNRQLTDIDMIVALVGEDAADQPAAVRCNEARFLSGFLSQTLRRQKSWPNSADR